MARRLGAACGIACSDGEPYRGRPQDRDARSATPIGSICHSQAMPAPVDPIPPGTAGHRLSSLAITYLVVAVIGLVGTAICNVLGVITPVGNPFAAWFANPATTSLSIDLLATASAASIFIIMEARRLGMRWAWLYVIGSFVTAVAFTFPLFLAMRERHVDTLRHQ